MPRRILAYPKATTLSNGKFTTFITDSGIGFSKIGNIFLNRFREDTINANYGNFIYLKDSNGQIFSNTLAPLFDKPKNYEAKFNQTTVEFKKIYENLTIDTTIFVEKNEPIDIRYIKLTNTSNVPIELEILTYQEVLLNMKAADCAHMVFSNLFVQIESTAPNELLCSRRPVCVEDKRRFLLHKLILENEVINENNFEYETNRANFLGRCNFPTNPDVIFKKELTNKGGAALDPIASLKTTVKLNGFEKIKFSILSFYGEDKEEIIKASSKYNEIKDIENAFCELKSNINTKPRLYDLFLSRLFFIHPCQKQAKYIKKNTLWQDGFWKYGISGDNPIITFEFSRNFEALVEVIENVAFLNSREIKTDLVIIDNSGSEFDKSKIEKFLTKEMFFLKKSEISKEFFNLLGSVSHIFLKDFFKLKSQLTCETTKPININLISEKIRASNANNSINLNTRELEFWNGYGGFSKTNEYVIKLKNFENTPMPWCNVISNPSFGMIINECQGGYVWHKNSRENKLTPWYNDTVADKFGERIYIYDKDKKTIFSPFHGLVKQYNETLKMDEEQDFKFPNNDFLIKHGLGYSKFESKSGEIEQKTTNFVALNDPVKITVLKLKNTGSQNKKLKISHFLRPVLGVDEATSRNIQINRLNTTFIAKNKYSELKDESLFLDFSLPISDFTTDRDEFFGSSRGNQIPEGVYKASLSHKLGAGYDPSIVTRYDLELAPGQEKNLILIIGAAKKTEFIKKLCQKYKKLDNVKLELQNVVDNWKNITGKIQIKTPDPAMDLMLNGWLIYQTLSCRIFGKSGYYQSGGAYGFRDQLQDSMAMCYSFPEITRVQILKSCAHQFSDGDVQHWWHEMSKNLEECSLAKTEHDVSHWNLEVLNTKNEAHKGIRTKFSDDLLWLPYVVAEYVKITGDFAILAEKVAFLKGEALDEKTDERYFTPEISDEIVSVYEHCLRAIKRSLRFGKHGLPLIGTGDWNDGMNKVGNQGKGESVWVAWFLISILNEFIEISNYMGDTEIKKEFEKISKELSQNVNENAWDGKWYKRAFFDDGTPLGSSKNKECKIDSISQSWAVISGASEEKKSDAALKSVWKNLVDEQNKIIKLLDPPFYDSELEPGYIKGYVPGIRENGGQYTHAAVWYVIALARAKKYEKAYEAFCMLNPINHSSEKNAADIYKVEPYVVSADIYSNENHVGRGGWTWYTGAAGWYYRAGIEEILGFKKTGETIYLNPRVPRTWKEYEIIYKKDDKSTLKIKIENPNGKNGLKKTRKIELNNRRNEQIVVTLDE